MDLLHLRVTGSMCLPCLLRFCSSRCCLGVHRIWYAYIRTVVGVVVDVVADCNDKLLAAYCPRHARSSVLIGDRPTWYSENGHSASSIDYTACTCLICCRQLVCVLVRLGVPLHNYVSCRAHFVGVQWHVHVCEHCLLLHVCLWENVLFARVFRGLYT